MQTVKIYNMDHNGRGIGKYNDKIVFIPNVIISELVEFKITNDKKNYYEGELVNIIEKSNERVLPICPYFGECGGCDLMHMTYSEQIKYKKNKVLDILKKYAKIENIEIDQVLSADELYNYRNKTTFQVDKRIGFYKKKSNEVIDIDYCYISDEKINNILKELKKLDFTNIIQVIVRSSKSENDMIIVIDVNDNFDEKSLDILKNYAESIVVKKGKKYKIVHGKGYIVDSIGDKRFIISPSSFFQVNTVQATRLYNKVLSYAKSTNNEMLLDLYCGTGTIGIYLSNYFKKIIGVEINKEAVEDAFKNKELNNILNIDFVCSDVKDFSKKTLLKPNTVIVDPPRSGLDNNLISYLVSNMPENIIYVSCDPVTLARDLDKLHEKYDVLKCSIVDMFVHTYHVECVLLLSIKKNNEIK